MKVNIEDYTKQNKNIRNLMIYNLFTRLDFVNTYLIRNNLRIKNKIR